MDRVSSQPTDRFVATDDAGKRYKVIEYTGSVKSTTFGNRNAKAEVLKEYRLTDGSYLNRLSETEFEIVRSGVIIHKS